MVKSRFGQGGEGGEGESRIGWLRSRASLRPTARRHRPHRSPPPCHSSTAALPAAHLA
jgi:hypothetical protein